MNISTPPSATHCRRCNGTGEFSRFHGVCFKCFGAGYTYPTAKAVPQHSVSSRRRATIIDIIRTRATVLDGFPNGPIEVETSWARGLLEDKEPARFERLVTSVEIGRVDAVIAALREYHHQHATEA